MDGEILRKIIFFMLCLWSFLAISSSVEFTPNFAFQGGYAAINSSKQVQNYLGNDDNLFIYSPLNAAQNSGFYGVFVGGEHQFSLKNYLLNLQVGVEYNNFNQIDVTGVNLVGVTPSSSTQYAYSFAIKSQQALVSFRLVPAYYKLLNPYLETALGLAFNHAANYTTSTSEQDSLNITPDFANQSTTKFSYIFGAGLNLKLNSHINASLGYRYSFLGSAKLGSGYVSNGINLIPVLFTVTSGNLYANQLLARISYTL